MTGLGGPDPLGELAEGIARAALAVPGVAALSGGAFGAVATSLPGRRVVGVALREMSGEVAFVGELGYDLRAVAERVRASAEELAGRPIDVVVADLQAPGDRTVGEHTESDER